MKLATWLHEHNIQRNVFAKRIGVSPSYITALCAGAVWPGRQVMEHIVRETAGAVQPNDFLEVIGDADAIEAKNEPDEPSSRDGEAA